MSDRFDELTKLFDFINRQAGFFLELPEYLVQVSVLVIVVPEYRPAVIFQLGFQRLDEIKIRQVSNRCIKKLASMFDTPIFMDNVMRKLKGDAFIGRHSPGKR